MFPEPKSQPLVVRFYDPRVPGRDNNGRTLQKILGYNDVQLEYDHTYIQTLFPLPEASRFNYAAPIVDRATFDTFRARAELRGRLKLSFERLLRFYGLQLLEVGNGEVKVTPADNWTMASRRWVVRVNHNHMRITRIIRSLRVLGLEKEAKSFWAMLQDVNNLAERDRIGESSLMFWRRAAERPLYLAPEDEEDDGHGRDFLYEFEREKAAKEQIDGVGSSDKGSADADAGNGPTMTSRSSVTG
jgi:hypothetical protein